MKDDYYSYTVKSFKRWAPIYDLFTLPVARTRRRVVALAGAEKGMSVLDVCTGTGGQALAFAKIGCEVVGIDLSEDMLEKAGKKNRRLEWRLQVADATALPFDDDQFDISCISLALHDMPWEVRGKVVDEMKRVSGKVVVVDYHIPGNLLHRLSHVWFTSLYESRYYRDFAKRNDLDDLLMRHGLKVVVEDYGLIDFFKILVCEREERQAPRKSPTPG